MSDNTISILQGSTFLVSSPNGDIDAGPNQPQGLFYKDMRHLSKWKLSIEGITLDVLSADANEYYYAQHFCVPPSGTIYKNPTIAIVRRRFIADGFVEDVAVLNHGTEAEEIELRLEVGCDFTDLFEVKDALAKKGNSYQKIRDHQLVLGYRRESFVRETLIGSTTPATEEAVDKLIFRITLQPKSCWNTKFHVKPMTSESTLGPIVLGSGNTTRRDLKQWLEQAPSVTCHPEAMRVYGRPRVERAARRSVQGGRS